MVNLANAVTPDNYFDNLKFLKTQEEILGKLEQREISEKPDKRSAYTDMKYASTQSTRKGAVCGDKKHRKKIFICKGFKEPGENLNAVEKLVAYKRCLVCLEEDSDCNDTYLCRNQDCRRGSS